MSDNLNSEKQPHQYDVDDALTALRDNPEQLSTAISYGLSDVPEADAVRLQSVWDAVEAADRQAVLAHLVDVSEANFEFNYRTVGLLALRDPDDVVRVRAIDLLWEDESVELLDHLLDMALWDPVEKVRAAAVSAVGRFILLGEYGKLPESTITRAQDVVIQIWNNNDEQIAVRRRALEAISNSSHAIVPEAIREAYDSNEHQLVVSSVYAMGRSCDERWSSAVLKELESDEPERRYEAARASGELELKEAVRGLGRLALAGDPDIQAVAIWSLGEIGGDVATQVLEKVAETLDPDEWQDAIEDALGNANLGSDMLDLLDFQDIDMDDDLL